jgi:alanyl-tRNA synthetase
MVQQNERQVLTYLTDTYRFAIDTVVIDAGRDDAGGWVAVRDNIVHPQGGGQPADQAWVDDVPVAPARDVESGLVLLRQNAPAGELPLVGDSVHVRIDADGRRRAAALHTAGHLVEAVVQPFGWVTVGNSHFPGQSRVEFTTSDPAAVDTPERRGAVSDRIRAAAAAAIADDLPVTADLAADGNRTVTVGALHTVPCGGTHVSSLAELAEFDMPDVRVKKGRIKASYTVEYGHRG